jgi:hypothetical protein
MSEIADGKIKRKRKSRVSASSAGENLVLSELLRREFDAQLGPREHEVLVRAGGRPPAPIQVKAAHSPPWHVRNASLLEDHADDVTVLALLGIEKTKKSARFFVAKDSDLAAQFAGRRVGKIIREPSNRRAYGYIDFNSVEKYEDNWDILK